MKLGDRLKQASGDGDHLLSDEDPYARDDDRAVDPFADIKLRAQNALFAKLDTTGGAESGSEDDLKAMARKELAAIIERQDVPLSADERSRIVDAIARDVLGYGPITPFLEDPEVTEVMANNVDGIFVERRGLIELTDARFADEAHLRRVIDRIVDAVGRRIDESSPMVDARLPDGSRVNAIIPPLAVDGPALTIRKFAREVLTVEDLIQLRTASKESLDLLSKCVEGRLNVLVTGGTGTGKTTLLNLLSNFIPLGERVVTIEDAVELRLQRRHVIRLEARPQNLEGRGEITVRDLVRNSLRMRPDRIIVGEVRGGEALDMLQAMNTGHDGSLSTLHANTPRDALSRLETMVLMAGIDIPVKAIREQVAAAVDLIVHLSRLRDGTRRITSIAEIEGMEQERITINTVFEFDLGAGVDGDGHYLGSLQPTGIRPKFIERLAEHGVTMDPAIFRPTTPVKPSRRKPV